MKRYFFDNWKNKSELEFEAVKTFKRGLKILLGSLPHDKTISIYLKGSFIRREMNKHSDVDFYVITKDLKTLNRVINLNRKYREEFKPKINFGGNTLSELKRGEISKTRGKRKSGRANPDRAALHLRFYELVYGKIIDTSDFKKRDDKERLNGLVDVTKKLFLPSYRNGKLGFQEIIKTTLWVVFDEQTVRGWNESYSWIKLAKSIKNKNHIVHDAVRYRFHPTKDEAIKKKFIQKLERYIEQMIKFSN